MIVADAIDAVRSFVDVFITIYILLILAYIITSWIRLPYSPILSRVQRFLFDVCDPFLRLFRRVLPSLGPLDLSPMIGVFTLILLRVVLDSLLERLH